MPRPHPPEFRLRAVELARERAKPIAEIARDLGISESCVRNWIAKSDIEEGRRDGVTAADRAETVALRRKLRLSRWKTKCCAARPRTLLGTASSQNDVRLHR